MSPEKQNAAIHEACGPKLFVLHKPIHDPFGYYREYACGYTNNLAEAWKVTAEVAARYTMGDDYQPDRVVAKPAPIPDYLNDLNAIRKAVLTLNAAQRERFTDTLWLLVNRGPCELSTVSQRWNFLIATPAQIAEAFLRTIGKWEETNVQPSPVRKPELDRFDRDEPNPIDQYPGSDDSEYPTGHRGFP